MNFLNTLPPFSPTFDLPLLVFPEQNIPKMDDIVVHMDGIRSSKRETMLTTIDQSVSLVFFLM